MVGEYTKGVSSNPKRYFDALDRRVRREKADPKKVVLDLQNPLFAMIRGPVIPLAPKNGQDPKPGLSTELSTQGSRKRDPKKWVKVDLADLSKALGIPEKRGRVKQKRAEKA